PSFRLTLRLANQLFIYVSSPIIKKGTAGCCSYESRGVWVREAAARLRLQSRRQLIEFGGQLVQRRTGLGGMVDVLLVGRGNLGDLGDIARDVLGYAGLLLGRGSNLAVHVADGLYRQRDLLQAVARQGHLLHAGVTAVLAAFDRPGGLLGAILHVADDGLDLGGGLAGALGQGAYLIGDHGKTTAGLARAGGFDGGIQREQVGLLGNVLDHLQYLADAQAVAFQLMDDLGGMADFPEQGLHGLDGLVHHQAALARVVIGGVGRARGIRGVARHFGG